MAAAEAEESIDRANVNNRISHEKKKDAGCNSHRHAFKWARWNRKGK